MAEIQTTLFDRPAILSRRSDPETSRDAGNLMIESGTLAEHERVALALVRLHPGRTGAELDRIAAAKKRQVSKRLAGLRRKGLVRRGGGDESRTCQVNGNRCVTWWGVEKGNQEAC